LATPVVAGEGAFWFEQDGPVIVDRGAALDPAVGVHVPARPVPRSQASTAQVASLANVRVERTVEEPCGARTPERLVLCLDTDGRFSATDELALLARVPAATSIEVGSIRARAALLVTLQSADVTPVAAPVITAFADCTGACDGRIVIRSAP
jgi:hypothetical protein